MTAAFLPTTSLYPLRLDARLKYSITRRRPRHPVQPRRPATACAHPPTDAATNDAFLLPESTLPQIIAGTMLENENLELAFTTLRDGFDNEVFFDKITPLGGVPSLVLGRTIAGVTFGGYTANGFLARDDYREATTERSMFVFRLTKDGSVLIAENTDPVQYDFYDYAVRFGAALLGVPMNPGKHTMKSNVATSSCRLPNGETSVFGDSTLAKIEKLQVWVAKRYVDEVKAKQTRSEKGFFARLFG